MILKNKLGIDDPSELAREEERIGKTKAAALFPPDCPASLRPGRSRASPRYTNISSARFTNSPVKSAP